MAELTISSDDIRGALERYVSSVDSRISREEVGVVSYAGDGIAQVEGLPSTMANELLEFEDGTLGVSLNLDVREIGVVVLGDFERIEEGQQVKRTGRVLSVPVGDGFLAGWSTRSARRSTAWATSPTRASASWSSRRPTSWPASPSRSPCRPASRRSTP